MHDPLLLRIILFTSASFLNEQGSIPETLVFNLKSDVYNTLSSEIKMQSSGATDIIIAAVSQLVIDSWYWGAGGDLNTHVKGLKRMILLRGGLQNLGMQGYLAKTIVV